MDTKLEKLNDILRGTGRMLIAYSGGVDSTFLVAAARKVLGRDNVLAVTAVSETYPASEKAMAKRMARRLRVRHILIETEELSNEKFRNNPPERCYYCKDELFAKLSALARREKMVLCDATNYSDRTDYRPGRKAAARHGVTSPLLEARLTKDDIRAFSRRMRLPTWDQPAKACLASRFPYGMPLSKESLRRVERAEVALENLGFRTLRLRNHGEVARIEVGKDELPRMLDAAVSRKVIAAVKREGWRYVTVDLEGYRTGSLNPPGKKRHRRP